LQIELDQAIAQGAEQPDGDTIQIEPDQLVSSANGELPLEDNTDEAETLTEGQRKADFGIIIMK